MELTWMHKLRITAVALLGILVIGLLAWPLAAPANPLSPVRASNLGVLGTLILLVLAFGLGFAGYFAAWPYGREIGVLAVPFGLAIWAGRCGPMRVLMQAHPQAFEREALAWSLRFEAVYWLLIVGAGFAGVLIAQLLAPPASHVPREQPDPMPGPDPQRHFAPRPARREEGGFSLAHLRRFLPADLSSYLITGLAVLAAGVLITHFFVGVFVQDITTFRNMPPTQPATGQILFGVTAAFAVTAFAVKKFANLGYLWPILGSAFVMAFAQAIYGGTQTIRQFAETRPATFFAHSTLAVLPVQLVALGTLGSILGYWIAVRYDWWRKHESGQA